MAVDFQMPPELCEEFEQLSLGFLHHTSSAAFEAVPTLESEIRQHQKEDEKLQEIRELLKKGKAPHFREDDQGTLWYKNRICVLDVNDLRKMILSEAGLSRESKLGRYAWAGKREVAMGRAELQGFGLVWTL